MALAPTLVHYVSLRQDESLPGGSGIGPVQACAGTQSTTDPSEIYKP